VNYSSPQQYGNGPRESRLISTLTPQERERLEPLLERVDLSSNQTLLSAGEPIEYLWFPNDCITSTVVDTPEGSTIEVGLMGMEGVVGLSLIFGRTLSNTTVIVQIPGSAYRLRARDAVDHVIGPHTELYDGLLRYADAFMALVAQTAACNSLHNVDQRMARWVLLTQDRVGRDMLPLTQEFLSYMLGVRRATVSEAAAGLQGAGIIQYSRGQIRVLDRERLEQNACACYAIVRTMTDSLYEPSA
jgi:CRP-like cAMP-binding protein